MKKLSFKILIFCIALTATAKAQQAVTPDHGNAAAAEVIFKKMINTPEIKNQEVKMVVVTFKPGEVSGPHRHPIQTFAYVLEGEFESTFEGKVYHYKKGDSFYEEPNGLHGGTRNLSPDKPAKLLAIFIGDPKKPFLIPEKK